MLIRFIKLVLVTLTVFPIAFARADVTGNYSTSHPLWIAYLQITQTKNKVTGYIQFVVADQNKNVQIHKNDIQGIIVGNSISIKVGSFFGFTGASISGKKSSGKLILDFPSKDGKVQTYIFSPSTTKAWNKSVIDFQRHFEAIITQERNNSVITARKNWLNQQYSKLPIEITNLQSQISYQLSQLQDIKTRLKNTDLEILELNKKHSEAQLLADTTKKNATDINDKMNADELQFKANNIKFNIGDAEFRRKSVVFDANQILDSIDRIKVSMKELKTSLINVQAEMSQLKMEYVQVPEFSQYMAVVKAPSAKIRSSIKEDSSIVREVREGTYLGVIIRNDAFAAIVFPNEQTVLTGVVKVSDVEFLNIDDIGRQIFGKLGTVTILEAKITKYRDENSEILATTIRDNVVCIIGEQGDWLEILLQSGLHGWIKRVSIHTSDDVFTKDLDGKLVPYKR